MDLGLEGTVALVTGAGGNIGQSICRALAGEGVHVIATDLDPQACPGGFEALALNVTDEAQWQQVVEQVEQRHGKLDILVNNAGVAPTARIDEMPLSQFLQAMEINVAGVFLGTKACARLMAQSGTAREGGSSLINIASGAADKPAAFSAAYCASKAAVAMFTRATAVEFSALGYPIRVNAVHPGAVRSDMIDSILAKYQAITGAEPEQLLEGMKKVHPMGRLVEPDEVADAVVFLASRAARYTHASSLNVDGGNSGS